jgi:hypothetical protein
MNTNNTRQNTDRSTYIIIGLVVLVLLLALSRILAVAGANLFIFLDKLLSFGNNTPAVTGWIFLGILCGLICGTWVAFKKYKLKSKLLLAPLLIMALFILILFMANHPLRRIDRPVPVVHTADAHNFIDVGSSGYLSQQGQLTYTHYNLVDFNDSTAWIENAKYAGIGFELRFTFNERIDNLKNCRLVAFRIRNGYTKSQKLWQDHNRVKDLVLYFNSNLVQNLFISDSFDPIEIYITPTPVKNGDVVTLSISSVYSGKKRPDQTAISALMPIIQYEE